jgi:hypothetical protein
MTPLRFMLALLVCSCWCGLSRAEEQAAAEKPTASKTDDNPHLWKPRTRSVAVFKNGYGFFLRDGEVALRDGWAVAREIPPATFGTLVIFSHNKEEMVDVVGSGPGEVVEFDGLDAPTDAATKRARLTAALHLKVELTYARHGEDRKAAGKIASVGTDFIVLDAGASNFAVPLGGIKRMQVLELPLRIHVARDAGKPAEKTRLGMGYLREGITWIPEYSLRLLDDTTAELTLRGTVINEAEDLVHTDMHFVVGVPHFAHTQYLAPVAVSQVIRTIGASVAPNEVRTQIMNRAGVVNTAPGANQFDRPGVVEQPAPAPGKQLKETLGNLPQLEGPGQADYTVYTKKDLTLRRGERAIVTLFVKKINYGHVYRWSPPERMQHFLTLSNDTDSAWTTGPFLAMSADQPLSEDLLRYTPKAGKVEVPVSAAINIAHDKSEIEVDRRLKAHSPRDHVFLDLVTLEGELKLKNFEKIPADVIVTVQVPGKPIESSDNGVRSADPTKLQLLERLGTIRWQITIKPGESKTLRYRYERFVPSS